MKEETYTQCQLGQGDRRQMAWIPSRGAHVDYEVEMKPQSEFWRVLNTYDTVSESVIKANERNYTTHRKATDI